MADALPPPELRPVPGTARGRGRVMVDLVDMLDRPTRRRAGVFRRALRREASRLHDPKRIAAVLILAVTFSLLAAGIIARGDAAGADARAYWAGVRIWVNGGDPYNPTGPFMPYVYAPWMLPLFAPWALLPWDVAWVVWRLGTTILLLWTIHWAYRRQPLPTAIIVAILAFPFGANLDTGNINLQLTLMVWWAQFSGPRLGGFLWALATWMKWIPVIHWFILAALDAPLGPALARAVDRVEPGPAPAHDHPVPGAVRVRGAPRPAGLPRLPLGVRAVALPAARSVGLPPRLDLAALGRRARARGSGGRLRADHWRGRRDAVLASTLVDRPQQ